MKKSGYGKKQIIPLLILLVIAIAFILSWSAPEHEKLPQAEKGVIDLSEWSFQEDGVVELDGQWEFYWNQLWYTANHDTPDSGELTGYYSVPSIWSNYLVDGKELPSEGYATYRLIIETGKEEDKLLGLKIPWMGTAYNAWVNGEKVFTSGVVGTSSETTRPHYETGEVFFNSDKNGEIELIIEVSNFHHVRGGIFDSIELGTAQQIKNNQLLLTAGEMFLAGALFIIGLYYLCFFLFRKKEKAMMYIAGSSLLLSVRVLFTGDHFINNLMPGLNWEYAINIEYLIMSIPAYFFMKFYQAIFPEEVGTLNPKICGIILIAYVITIVTLPMRINSVLLTYFIIYLVYCLGFITFALVKACIRKKENSYIGLAGSIVFFITIVNDILYVLIIVDTGFLVPWGLLVFLFSQAVILSKRISRAFDESESYSEKLLNLNRLKDEFLAKTSHELRTPINGIIGVSEALIKGSAGKLPPKASENLALIVSSGKRLSRLIDDILDFSKLKNKDIQLEKKDIDISQMSHVVVTVVGSMLYGDNNVRLTNEVPQNIPLVYGDENRIYQIMYNLVGNAVKFTRQGYVRVTARDKDEQYVEVCVEDTGIGIPPEKQEEIFNSFEQAENSISREFEGTGLGLSITKKLVELHGGTIHLESEPGTGSKFFFTLPKSRESLPSSGIKESHEEINGIQYIQNTQEAKEPGLGIPPGPENRVMQANLNESKDEEEKIIVNTEVKILVVDDEKINVQVVADHLALHQFSVETASNGIEALEKIEHNSYDLVLLDVMMPKMSGYEVCKKIRETYSLYELPVIMLTAKNQPQDIVAGFEVGANDYLAKPFEASELIARTKTLISMKSAVKSAIDNAVKLGETKKLAEIDGLTGASNRRHLFEVAAFEWERAVDNGLPLALLMVDIDNLKIINDNYGHLAGDETIKFVADRIHNAIKGRDTLGRYGGEEFCVILPDTSKDAAFIIAERIRKEIEDKKILVDRQGEIRCTVSIGIAVYSGEEKEFVDLIDKADNMLYRAKDYGKNRVEG